MFVQLEWEDLSLASGVKWKSGVNLTALDLSRGVYLLWFHMAKKLD